MPAQTPYTLDQQIAVAYHPSYHPDDGTDGVPARKAEAAAQLAPVLAAMTSPGLFRWFRVALQSDMAGTGSVCHNGDLIDPDTRERLTLGRNMIRVQLTDLDLIALPPGGVLLLLGDAAITILGDPPVFDTTGHAQSNGWKIL